MPISLQEIVRHKQAEIACRKTSVPLRHLVEAAQKASYERFDTALRDRSSQRRALHQPVKLILEIKPASPSAGPLAEQVDLLKILRIYNPYAAAISVLTDQKYFNGSMTLLADVASNSSHPILCKDFILDSYQVYEARLAGAHAVLLIVKLLSDEKLLELHTLIRKLGMISVIEIQNEKELERAIRIEPSIILINNRNLETFEVSLQTTCRLAPQVPAGITIISASGIEHRSDIDILLPFSSCFLIGSALMKTALGGALEQKLLELSGE